MQQASFEQAPGYSGARLGANRSESWKKIAARIFIVLQIFLAGPGLPVLGQATIGDANPLALPETGSCGLRALSPTVLELTLITTKAPDPGGVSAWDFVNADLSPKLPSIGQFIVRADGLAIPVTGTGFKRRPIYAAEKRDLRIASSIYLNLAAGVAVGQRVEVLNPSGEVFGAGQRFELTVEGGRYSPAIHVNQAGYMPDYPKKAQVGYYLGSMGELHVPAGTSFSLVETLTGLAVYQGTLRARPDQGFSYQATPYQKVLEADFSAFKTAGEYRLAVSGLGASLPFRVNGGVTANFARTFALGLVNQRCGFDCALPFTRHTHGRCHTAPAEVPTMEARFGKTQDFLGEVSSDFAKEPRHTAPQLRNVAASLYPFVRQGKIDVSGGHHDAGDYSKYTINSAGLIHFLVLAADSFAGAGALDNLGIPESGDGRSDLLQEAKWEADYLAKMQDSDGGFYFLVYPRDRRYENNVLPDQGDPQVVWPKNTAVTAAAVAALAEAGSSPLLKAQFPAEAAGYMEKAELGWSFLMGAIAAHGKDGAYQKMTHYGNEFGHDDELAWAAAAMYAATGKAEYQAKLFEFMPDPNDPALRRWTWWRMFEGYGCAIRTYGFAARSGRLTPAQVNAGYLAKCDAEMIAAADDQVRFSRQSAYGTSFPDTNKQYRSAGWYFSSERAFDVTVAQQIRPAAEYVETVVANLNYEGGSNPLNITYVTGIGWKRQREVVSQYAWNDRRILPPAGLPQGNIQSGFGYLETYKSPVTGRNELPGLAFPGDFANTDPYAFYDRWTDMINTTTEFVVMDQARSLASLSYWMAQGEKRTAPWQAVSGQIIGLDKPIVAGEPATLALTAGGVDLAEAQVLWEVRHLEPQFGNAATIVPKFAGEHWIEAEALLPDGRRVVAVSNFVARVGVMAPNRYRSAPLNVTSDSVALYHLDENFGDATTRSGALAPKGQAHLDGSNTGWMAQRAGRALRVLDLGDGATVQIPTKGLNLSPSTTGITLEAMIYINEWKAFNRDVATILSLKETWNASLELIEDRYVGPMIKGGNAYAMLGAALKGALGTKVWHHLSIGIDRAGYTVRVDGETVGSAPSGDLQNWGRSGGMTLELGNMDGWLDEVTIRSSGQSHAVLTPLRSPGQGGFRLRLAGEAGKSYRIQASQDSRTWSDLGSVTLTGSTGEFADMTIGPSYRFYRAVTQ